ncbi:unnamed protein product [Sympodiomycopsis kandeliae]
MNVTAVPRGPIRNLFTTLGNFLRIGEGKYLKGTDLEGNSYFEYPSRHNDPDPRKTRRVIKYKIKEEYYFDYDRSNLPIQWKMWLRHTRRDAPSLPELQQDRQRILQLQENVRLIAIRDEEARQRMEQSRTEEHDAAIQPQAIPPERPQQSQSQSFGGVKTKRKLTATIPTSEINDKGASEEKKRRVPLSMPTSNTDSEAQTSTDQGERLSGQTLEYRNADQDVWKASRARVKNQDQQQQQNTQQQKRQHSTDARSSILTPQVIDRFRQ